MRTARVVWDYTSLQLVEMLKSGQDDLLRDLLNLTSQKDLVQNSIDLRRISLRHALPNHVSYLVEVEYQI